MHVGEINLRTLNFQVDKPVYLLGACVTETDRQFYSPKLKYDLRLLDIGNSITVDDGNDFIVIYVQSS